MKAEHANIFVQSAVTVFQKELGIELTRQAVTKKEKPIPGRPMCIVLGITGDMKGQVVYAMDESFAMDITHQMMPNMLPSALKKLVTSAVGEMGNMITGQATIALAGQDRRLDLTPPTVLTGQEISIDFLEMPTITLQMLSEMGVLEINIAIEEKEAA